MRACEREHNTARHQQPPPSLCRHHAHPCLSWEIINHCVPYISLRDVSLRRESEAARSRALPHGSPLKKNIYQPPRSDNNHTQIFTLASRVSTQPSNTRSRKKKRNTADAIHSLAERHVILGRSDTTLNLISAHMSTPLDKEERRRWMTATHRSGRILTQRREEMISKNASRHEESN